MLSLARRGARAPSTSADEETELLSRHPSVSKAPETHPSDSLSHSHPFLPRPPSNPKGQKAPLLPGPKGTPASCPPCAPLRLPCVLLSLLYLGLAGVLGYLVIFCWAWALHTRSPAAMVSSLSGHEALTNPLLGADFRHECSSRTGECSPFLFGLATAPAHVEDKLNDSWLEFALEKTEENSPLVHAWRTAAIPEQRLRFWTQPEVEVDLAAATGIGILRLGVDWGRVVPSRPPLERMGDSATLSVVDWSAVERYKEILQLIHSRGLKTMVTLFHHSFPKWGLPLGAWLNKDFITLFTQFAAVAAEHLGPFVDSWVTFNEPTIFTQSTHCWCSWPPAPRGSCGAGADPWAFLCPTPWGRAGEAMRNIGVAHRLAYPVIKQKSKVPVGVAHSIAVLTPFSILDLGVAYLNDAFYLFPWIDSIADNLDFCGLNYYGQEFVSLAGLHMVEGEEYSEAGRAVYPDGLFKLLMAFHRRYHSKYPSLRFMITENGIADAQDTIRRPYLLEHLLAVHAAIAQGVPVDGYIHWTISDNWEWSDGYCPKFGLVEVQRGRNLTRVPRKSYQLYGQVVQSRVVTAQQRQAAWQDLQVQISKGEPRPVCRIPAPSTLMAPDQLDHPADRAVSKKDWRFGQYKHASLVEMAQRAGTVLRAKFWR